MYDRLNIDLWHPYDSLGMCAFNSKAALQLAKVMRSPDAPALHSLNLSDHALSPRAFIALTASLQSCTTLSELDLSWGSTRWRPTRPGDDVGDLYHPAWDPTCPCGEELNEMLDAQDITLRPPCTAYPREDNLAEELCQYGDLMDFPDPEPPTIDFTGKDVLDKLFYGARQVHEPGKGTVWKIPTEEELTTRIEGMSRAELVEAVTEYLDEHEKRVLQLFPEAMPESPLSSSSGLEGVSEVDVYTLDEWDDTTTTDNSESEPEVAKNKRNLLTGMDEEDGSSDDGGPPALTKADGDSHDEDDPSLEVERVDMSLDLKASTVSTFAAYRAPPFDPTDKVMQELEQSSSAPPPVQKRLQRQLTARMPNTSRSDLDEVLSQAGSLIEQESVTRAEALRSFGTVRATNGLAAMSRSSQGSWMSGSQHLDTRQKFKRSATTTPRMAPTASLPGAIAGSPGSSATSSPAQSPGKIQSDRTGQLRLMDVERISNVRGGQAVETANEAADSDPDTSAVDAKLSPLHDSSGHDLRDDSAWGSLPLAGESIMDVEDGDDLPDSRHQFNGGGGGGGGGGSGANDGSRDDADTGDSNGVRDERPNDSAHNSQIEVKSRVSNPNEGENQPPAKNGAGTDVSDGGEGDDEGSSVSGGGDGSGSDTAPKDAEAQKDEAAALSTAAKKQQIRIRKRRRRLRRRKRREVLHNRRVQRRAQADSHEQQVAAVLKRKHLDDSTVESANLLLTPEPSTALKGSIRESQIDEYELMGVDMVSTDDEDVKVQQRTRHRAGIVGRAIAKLIHDPQCRLKRLR